MRLLADLKEKHGFATTDQVLRYYLPSDIADNRPVFLTTKQAYDLTHRQPVGIVVFSSRLTNVK